MIVFLDAVLIKILADAKYSPSNGTLVADWVSSKIIPYSKMSSESLLFQPAIVVQLFLAAITLSFRVAENPIPGLPDE